MCRRRRLDCPRVQGCAHELGFSTVDRAVTRNLADHTQVRERYGNLPLSFEANHGQSDSTVKFLSRGNGYSLFLTSSEAVLVLSQSNHRKSAVVRMTLVNATPQSQAAGHDELPDNSSRQIGLQLGAAKLARSEPIARDVVFFYAEKAG